MGQETRVVKGGFRATLALIISIIALILAIAAYQSTGKDTALNQRIKELQAKIEDMNQKTTEKLDMLRNETAGALEKLGKSMKTEGDGQQNKQ
jgi:hypothetical protein